MRYTVVAAAALIVCSSSAMATPQCGDTAKMREVLAGKYDEAPAAIGLALGGHLVEVWASQEHRSWTMMISYANGTSCISGAGTDWEMCPRLPRCARP